jgi:hypothetical protein
MYMERKGLETVELMSRCESMVDGCLRPPVHCYLASSVAPTYLEASSIHDRRPQLVVWNIKPESLWKNDVPKMRRESCLP